MFVKPACFHAALKSKLIYNLPFSENLLFQHFFLKILDLSTSNSSNYPFAEKIEKNTFNFLPSSWQASPSLLQLSQFWTDLFT